jgi:hypothetical protein
MLDQQRIGIRPRLLAQRGEQRDVAANKRLQ